MTQSGLRYVVRKGASQVAYCSLNIRCGARDEGKFHPGIAHFCEHALFKGTRRKSAYVINNYLDRLGGELNAFTTKEEIVLHSTVLKEDLSKSASLLLELAFEPSFPEREIEKEKGVVIEEINSYKDSPADDVYDRFEEMLFSGHPLGRSILGTVSSVKKITSSELAEFVSMNFTPDRMVLSVVANYEEDNLERRVRKIIDRYYDI